MLARCRQCGAEYTYSVFGGVYYGLGAHYGLCPECTKKVENALKDIPKRYESVKTEIYNLPKGFKERVQELHDNPPENLDFPWEVSPGTLSVVTLPEGYTFSCSVVYQGCKYIVESKSEDNIFDDDTKVYVVLEYDLIEGKPTGKPWLNKEDGEGCYVKHSVCTWASSFISRINEETIKTLENCFLSHPLSKSSWPPTIPWSSDPDKPTSDP